MLFSCGLTAASRAMSIGMWSFVTAHRSWGPHAIILSLNTGVAKVRSIKHFRRHRVSMLLFLVVCGSAGYKPLLP